MHHINTHLKLTQYFVNYISIKKTTEYIHTQRLLHGNTIPRSGKQGSDSFLDSHRAVPKGTTSCGCALILYQNIYQRDISRKYIKILTVLRVVSKK